MKFQKFIDNIKKVIIELRHFLGYVIYSFILKGTKKMNLHILSNQDTVHKVINNSMSISRYGDGEFKWMIGMNQRNFQDDNEEMRKRLIQVIEEDNDKLLIGIPSHLNSMKKYTYSSKQYWTAFLAKTYKKLTPFLSETKIYCDSYITRPYLDIKNKNKMIIETRFNNLKKIWEKKDILIVEGKYSKLGVENDLFDNCKSISRIICPEKNAYSVYNEILDAIYKLHNNKLVLISLGPTATILSSDLSKKGIQSIDIGHIDIEYMWFLQNAKHKEKIKGKFVNEVLGQDENLDYYDNEYVSQIIYKVEEKK